jgi:hypothetical protein
MITIFEKTTSVCDRNHNSRHIVLNYDTLEDINLLQSLSKTLRKLSQQKNICLGSALQTVHLLHLRVYRIHAMHEVI